MQIIKLPFTVFALCLWHFSHAQTLISPNPMRLYSQFTSQDGYHLGDNVNIRPVRLSNDRVAVVLDFVQIAFTVYPSGLDFITEVLKGDHFEVLIKDQSGQVTGARSSVWFDTDTLMQYLPLGLFEQQDTLCLLSRASHVNGQEVFCLTRFDADFTFRASRFFPVDSILIHQFRAAEMDVNGNLYVCAQVSNTKRRVFKLNHQGVVVSESPLLNESGGYLVEYGGGVNMLNNSTLFVTPSYMLDTSLNMTCNFGIGGSFDDSYAAAFASNGNILIDGIRSTGSMSQIKYFDQVYLGDVGQCSPEKLLDTLVYTGPISVFTRYSSARYGLTYVDDQHIYHSYTKDGGLFVSTSNYVTLTSFRLDGTINWSYYYGGDEVMITVDIVPFSDGSVVHLVNSYNHVTGMDLKYVHFDQEGNIITPSGTSAPVDKRAVLLYPNPTSGTVTVSFPHDSFPAEASLQLSDALGNIVKTYHSLPQVLEMNELPAGIYFYHIYDAGRILQNGRIIKI
jgi:hypothetical protein